MPVEDQLSPRQWLRQAAQHEAEAEARLAEMDGQDPDSGYARYLLAAAAVRADLAQASATAARVVAVEGVTALFAATVKSTSTTKAVVTVTAPIAVAASVARVRVLGQWLEAAA